MRWEIEMEEIETVLETIWELHDKISDAILSNSRSHFLNAIRTKSTKKMTKAKRNLFDSNDDSNNNKKNGFVFVKEFRNVDDDDDDDEIDVDAAAMAEARSLNGIRTALENLEDQLEFFHTIQSQQRAERDAALARVEQSRIVLAMRLADHRGRKHKVIEEGLAFVGDVHDASRFIAPENLYEMSQSQPAESFEDQKGKMLSVMMQIFISSLALSKNSLKMEKIRRVLGNAALFAVSMLAFLKLHQFAFQAPHLQDQNFHNKMIERRTSESDCSSSQTRHFDVFSARG